MAHRNRGLLRFDELRSRISELTHNEALEQLLESLDELIEALQHSEGDIIVINLLLDVFKLFDNDRLSRFLIEYELTKDENDDMYIHQTSKMLSPNFLAYLNEEKKLLDKISCQSDSSHDSSLTDLEFLKPLKSILEARHLKFQNERKKNIILDQVSWKSVAEKLHQVIYRSKLKSHKFKDGYQLQDLPYFVVEFTLPSDSDMMIDDDEEPKLDQIAENHEVVISETQADSTKAIETNDVPIPDVEKDADNISLKRTASDGHQAQRASKRFRQQTDIEPDANRTDEFESFSEKFTSYMRNIGLNFEEITSFVNDENESYLKDFYNCLNNWTSRHSEFLSFNSSKGQTGLALNELINANVNSSLISTELSETEFSDEMVVEYLKKVNSGNYHFCEVRSLFLTTLMVPAQSKYPLIDCYLGRDFYNKIEDLVIASENDLFNVYHETDGWQSMAVSVSVLEILINYWINLKQKAKVKGLSTKALNELHNKSDHIHKLILRWRKLASTMISTCQDELLSVRLRWCTILFLQHEQKIPVNHLKKLLHELLDEFGSRYKDLTIEFPNYESLPSLSIKMIKNQSDKLNVLTTFEKTLSEGITNTSKVNILLETVLFAEDTKQFSDEERSMEEFLSGSSISLKLKLWKLLLDAYIANSDIEKYQKALTMVLSLLLDQIRSDAYNCQPELQRYQILLNTIGFYGDYINGFAQIIEQNNWVANSDGFTALFQNVVEFLRVLFCFNLHNYHSTNKPFHELALKSATKIRDIIANSLVVLLCFYSAIVENDELSSTRYDFFSLIHEEIGRHGVCDSASGRFLRLAQFLLENADPEAYECDILQHLNCRFHVFISNERFSPFDHHTLERPLDKDSAVTFAPSLLNLITRKRDPLFNILKPDLKSALDVFFKAVGDPTFTSTVVQKNDANIKQYLDSELEPRLFKHALLGSLDIGLRKTALQEQAVADKGLFYTEAATNLNVYKARKKAMQAKVTDLEDILKMIKSDLLYGANKAESWLLLGQTYSFQVEDDLIWTSDKLNVMEKKTTTALTQRKAILSLLMSLSIMINKEINGIQNNPSVFLLCLSSLYKELYHGLSKPMEGLCFQNQLKKKVLTTDGVSVLSSMLSKPYIRQMLLITKHLLNMSISVDGNDWLNFFYLAQVSHKIGSDVRIVLESSLQACQLSPSSIEPHYQLCSFLYKYVKLGHLSENEAIEYLHKTESFFGELSTQLDSSALTHSKFQYIIIQALKKINHVDKKKWHHKHRFRLSTIYYDLQDFEKAYEEIEPLIILKSTNKNLVNIWKPDLEPPGKHFVYTYNYILYYVKLVNSLADFHKLLLFTKKLRRYGSGMVNLNEAWDFACSTLCYLTKEIVRAEPGFTDIEVPKLIYSEFIQASQSLTAKYKSESLKEEEVQVMILLYEISEIRRMNNGFGSTSQLDDTFNTLYLKIYLKNVTEESKKTFVNQQTMSLVKPNGANIKTKVARRDILACATALVKVIEPKIKDFKVTDEIGIDVPEDIKMTHLSEAKNNIDKEHRSLDNKNHLHDFNLSTPSSKNQQSSLKTPEKDDEVLSIKSNPESEDEFHTPTSTAVFEIIDD